MSRQFCIHTSEWRWQSRWSLCSLANLILWIEETLYQLGTSGSYETLHINNKEKYRTFDGYPFAIGWLIQSQQYEIRRTGEQLQGSQRKKSKIFRPLIVWVSPAVGKPTKTLSWDILGPIFGTSNQMHNIGNPTMFFSLYSNVVN